VLLLAVQRLDHEHALALFARQRMETQLEGKAAQRRLVQVVEQVGGADEHACEALHALQHFVDLSHLVVPLDRVTHLAEHRVGEHVAGQAHTLHLAGDRPAQQDAERRLQRKQALYPRKKEHRR